MGVPDEILPQRAIVRRKSNLVGSQTFPFTLATTLAFQEPARLLFFPSGLTGDRTIDIEGTLDGVNQTESLTMTTTTGIVRSTKRWSTVTEVSSADSGGDVGIRAVYSSGEAAIMVSVVYGALPCRIRESSRPEMRETRGGMQEVAVFRMYHNASDLRHDDIIEVGFDKFRVDRPNPIYAPDGFHHAESILKRLGAAGDETMAPIDTTGLHPRRYHIVPNGTRPGTVFTLPEMPVVGSERGFFNLNGLARVASSPGVNEYTIAGTVITTGFTVTAGDYLEFDYDVP